MTEGIPGERKGRDYRKKYIYPCVALFEKVLMRGGGVKDSGPRELLGKAPQVGRGVEGIRNVNEADEMSAGQASGVGSCCPGGFSMVL